MGSTNQITRDAVTCAAGRSSPARIRESGSRLSAPATVKTTSPDSRDRGIGERQPVVGMGGVTRVGDHEPLAPRAKAGDPGKSDAVWPSGPSPRCTSATGPCIADQRVVRASSRVDGVGGSAHRVDRAGADLVEQRVARHALVRVGVVDRHEPLVAEEDVDRAPVDVGVAEPLVAVAAQCRRPTVRSTRVTRARRDRAKACATSSTTRSSPFIRACDTTHVDRDTVAVYEAQSGGVARSPGRPLPRPRRAPGGARSCRRDGRRPRVRRRPPSSVPAASGRGARRRLRHARAGARGRTRRSRRPGGSRVAAVAPRRARAEPGLAPATCTLRVTVCRGRSWSCTTRWPSARPRT